MQVRLDARREARSLGRAATLSAVVMLTALIAAIAGLPADLGMVYLDP